MTKAEATFPIFIAEGLDLDLFRSFEEAELKLEGIDVDDGIFVGFDAAGRRLRLEATGVKRGRFLVDVGKAHVSLDEASPSHSEELAALLREYLSAVDVSIVDCVDLEDLVEACKRFHNYEAT